MGHDFLVLPPWGMYGVFKKTRADITLRRFLLSDNLEKYTMLFSKKP
jgi:hypothetical protein